MGAKTSIPVETRDSAKHLYWLGWNVRQISEKLEIPPNTIKHWVDRYRWDTAKPIDIGEAKLWRRFNLLVDKEEKDGRDFKELDSLGRQIERIARVKKYEETGRESDLNPIIKRRNEAPKRKPKRNFLDEQQIDLVQDAFRDGLFSYQEGWREAGLRQRIRNILKSRQIGATWYFSREAIADAAQSGRNKIFLSASKAQAYIFRNYIQSFVKDVCGVELSGDPITLDNGANLYFLGTNAKTAQGYHGDVYVDEYFWIQRFLEFRKVVSGMAMHKKWRMTYSSTPSTLTHEAHGFWTGDLFNKRRPKGNKAIFEVDHNALAGGSLCPDGQWRQIVTIEDAVAGGCDLFDIDQLRMEYSPEEFRNLLMCEFADDTLSAFPLDLQMQCMIDSWETWLDVKPFASRPVGNAPVWLGYDPSGDGEEGDGAGLVVLLPPAKPGGKHRILERHRLHGSDYEEQAKFILDFLPRYNVEHIGIDVTGIGDAVAKIVAKQFPLVTRYTYTALLKMQMVLQAQQAMRHKRLEWDAGWSDLSQAFMAIRRDTTASGGAATYTAGRNRKTGHAEIAWAAMHALHHEPMEAAANESGASIMEMSG